MLRIVASEVGKSLSTVIATSITSNNIIMIQSLCLFTTQLPDVSSELQTVQNAISDINLDQLIEEGQQQFDSISQTITTTVDQNIGGKLCRLDYSTQCTTAEYSIRRRHCCCITT